MAGTLTNEVGGPHIFSETTVGQLSESYFRNAEVMPSVIFVKLPYEVKLLSDANDEVLEAHKELSNQIKSLFQSEDVQVICPHHYLGDSSHEGGEDWLAKAKGHFKTHPQVILNLPEFLFQFAGQPDVARFFEVLYMRLLRANQKIVLFTALDPVVTLNHIRDYAAEPRNRRPVHQEYELRDESGLHFHEEKVNNNKELSGEEDQIPSHFDSPFYAKVRTGELAKLVIKIMSRIKPTKFSEFAPGPEWYRDPRLQSKEFKALLRATAPSFGLDPEVEWDFEADLARADAENQRKARRDGKFAIPYDIAKNRTMLVKAIEKCLKESRRK